nr:hypothetical protein [Burkholderia cenocepacia]
MKRDGFCTNAPSGSDSLISGCASSTWPLAMPRSSGWMTASIIPGVRLVAGSGCGIRTDGSLKWNSPFASNRPSKSNDRPCRAASSRIAASWRIDSRVTRFGRMPCITSRLPSSASGLYSTATRPWYVNGPSTVTVRMPSCVNCSSPRFSWASIVRALSPLASNTPIALRLPSSNTAFAVPAPRNGPSSASGSTRRDGSPATCSPCSSTASAPASIRSRGDGV